MQNRGFKKLSSSKHFIVLIELFIQFFYKIYTGLFDSTYLENFLWS